MCCFFICVVLSAVLCEAPCFRKVLYKLQSSQSFCHMILLCVTLSGGKVSWCWCSWYAAVPSMPPGKKMFQFSKTLWLEPCDAEIMPNNRTKALSHCVRVWLYVHMTPILSYKILQMYLLDHMTVFGNTQKSYYLAIILILVLFFSSISGLYVPFLII